VEADRSEREIVLPAHALSSLHSAIREQVGEDAADRALLAAGRAADEAVLDGIETGLNEGAGALSESAFWSMLVSFFSRRGWGRLQHEDAHPGVGVLTGADWAEGGDRPFTQGLLAGLLSRAAGAEVEVVRIPDGDGDGPSFAFGAAPTLRVLQRRLGEGDSLGAALGAL